MFELDLIVISKEISPSLNLYFVKNRRTLIYMLRGDRKGGFGYL